MYPSLHISIAFVVVDPHLKPAGHSVHASWPPTEKVPDAHAVRVAPEVTSVHAKPMERAAVIVWQSGVRGLRGEAPGNEKHRGYRGYGA